MKRCACRRHMRRPADTSSGAVRLSGAAVEALLIIPFQRTDKNDGSSVSPQSVKKTVGCVAPAPPGPGPHGDSAPSVLMTLLLDEFIFILKESAGQPLTGSSPRSRSPDQHQHLPGPAAARCSPSLSHRQRRCRATTSGCTGSPETCT